MFIPLHDANYLRHIRLQYVTLFIIAANIVIWIILGNALFVSEGTVRATIFTFGFIPAVATGQINLPAPYDVMPEYLHYVTYAFLHADFMHLAGNMLFIWVFGDNVEDALGHIRFIVFFCLCAAAGAWAHAFANPDETSPLIGASGAAAGIISAYLLLHPHVKIWVLALGRIPLRLSALWIIGAWIAFQVFNFVWSKSDPVSWSAHVGGIVAGLVLLPFFKRRSVPLFDRTPVEEVIPPLPAPPVPPPPESPPPVPEAGSETGARPSPWGRQPRREE